MIERVRSPAPRRHVLALPYVKLRLDDLRDAERTLSELGAIVAGVDGAGLFDPEHSRAVASYASAIAAGLELDAERVAAIERAALLHDIGMAVVPRGILAAPGPLTPHQIKLVRQHPVTGAALLRRAGLAEEAAWVRAHHERTDGCGYPDGLSGREIPLEARIIFVADAFEALTSDRPYRPAVSPLDALFELSKHAGTQWDPDIVDAFVELVRPAA